MKKDNGTHRIRKGILAVFMNLILIIFSLSCIFPMIWMLYSSLKEKRAFNADIVGLPKNPTLINYIRILSNSDYHLGESMFNSVRTTTLSIILIVLFSFIVGYILARVHFKGNRALYVMFLMGMLIPIHSLLVPIYVVFKKCGISDQWYTLLLPYVSRTSDGDFFGRRIRQNHSGFAGRGGPNRWRIHVAHFLDHHLPADEPD